MRGASRPALPPEQLTVVWQSVSLLLDYPDEDAARPGRAAPVGVPRAADRGRATPCGRSSTTWSPRR